MAIKPILFSGPMVRALLEGEKQQTRRLLKPQPPVGHELVGIYAPGLTAIFNPAGQKHRGDPDQDVAVRLPYMPGDLLWVRETGNWRGPVKDACGGPDFSFTFYAADSERGRSEFFDDKNKPAIFMPRWASRLTLHVTDVRVQRLQAIGSSDALAEGVCETDFYDNAEHKVAGGAPWHPERLAFADLWNSINPIPNDWDGNPWVVAVSFVAHKCNVDEFQKLKSAA